MAFGDQDEDEEEETFRLNIPDDARTSQKESSLGFGKPSISYQARIQESDDRSLKKPKK